MLRVFINVLLKLRGSESAAWMCDVTQVQSLKPRRKDRSIGAQLQASMVGIDQKIYRTVFTVQQATYHTIFQVQQGDLPNRFTIWCAAYQTVLRSNFDTSGFAYESFCLASFFLSCALLKHVSLLDFQFHIQSFFEQEKKVEPLLQKSLLFYFKSNGTKLVTVLYHQAEHCSAPRLFHQWHDQLLYQGGPTRLGKGPILR